MDIRKIPAHMLIGCVQFAFPSVDFFVEPSQSNV